MERGRYDSTLTIPPDPFIFTAEYRQFLKYKALKHEVITAMHDKLTLPESKVDSLIVLNPDYFEAYLLAGEYYEARDETEKAKAYYRQSLDKEFANSAEKEKVEEKIKKLR